MNANTMNTVGRTERKRRMGLMREPAAARYQDGLNLYQYVRSDPETLSDPSGLGPFGPAAGRVGFSPDVPQGPWTAGDFVHHYLGEFPMPPGSPIDLANIGLLGAFQNAPDVQRSTQAFERLVREQALSARWNLDCEKNKTTTFTFKSNDVTNVTREIFAVGHSTFFRSSSITVSVSRCTCVDGKMYPTEYSWEAINTFGIKDSFKDPADMQNLIGIVVEHPGGTPYPINAQWATHTSGNGKMPTP